MLIQMASKDRVSPYPLSLLLSPAMAVQEILSCDKSLRLLSPILGRRYCRRCRHASLAKLKLSHKAAQVILSCDKSYHQLPATPGSITSLQAFPLIINRRQECKMYTQSTTMRRLKPHLQPFNTKLTDTLGGPNPHTIHIWMFRNNTFIRTPTLFGVTSMILFNRLPTIYQGILPVTSISLYTIILNIKLYRMSC